MIDLRQPTLPSALLVDGRAYEVRTSFRVWIEFERALREERAAWRGVFAGDQPEGAEWVEAAIEFLRSPNSTPRAERMDGPREVDLVEDGELIVAAFQQAYGIDLTATDMHWHRFKALLSGIPDDTRLAQVMSIRGYRKPPSKQDADAEARKRQREWALRDPGYDEARADVLKWAEELFGD